MSSGAIQTTPRPAPMPLDLEKSLPPPPPLDAHISATSTSGPRDAVHSAENQPRPSSSFLEVRSLTSEPTPPSLTRPLPEDGSSATDQGEEKPTLTQDGVDQKGQGLALDTQPSQRDEASTDTPPSQSSSAPPPRNGECQAPDSPEQYYSPYLEASASPELDRRKRRFGSSQHTANVSDVSLSTEVGSLSTTQGPASGHAEETAQSNTIDGSRQIDSTMMTRLRASSATESPSLLSTSRAGSGYFASLPDPSKYPVPSEGASPSGSRIGHGLRHPSHYSSDMSYRNSTSTRSSLWTERSVNSCNTSPGGMMSSGSTASTDPFSKLGEHPDHAEATEEIDEESVGLGITSEEMNMSAGQRRSSAAPIIPSGTSILEGSPALSGPFSHHRVPSWTRKTDIGSLSLMMPLQTRDLVEGGNPGMIRTQSETGCVRESAGRELGDRPLPSVPTRRDSRVRCSSESSQILNHRRGASSISSSISSSSRRSPVGLNQSYVTAPEYMNPENRSRSFSNSTTSSQSSAGHLLYTPAALQSPPRTSSLRQSPSVGSLRSITSLAKEPLSRSASIRRRPSIKPLDEAAMASKIPPRSGSIQEDLTPLGSATMSSATTAAAAPATSYPTSGGPPRIGEDIIRSRRASDASITSFLNGTEFSHILGAYAERFRWDDDGLYGFDESIEQAEEEDEEVSESQAVKTAEEGSAKIVRARGRACAAIESEIGPNTTHLILRRCADANLLQMLERVLPATRNLLVLDLSDCGLSALPQSLASCSSLEELDISRNPVGALPELISSLLALRVFSADGTGLHSLPTSLSHLQDLQCLSLRNNALTHLPAWLHRLPKLDRLFVEDNAFKGVWAEIVYPLVSRPNETQEAQPRHGRLGQGHGSVRSLLSRGQPANASTVGLVSAAPSAGSRPSPRRLKSTNDLQRLNMNMAVSSSSSPTDEFGSLSPLSDDARSATSSNFEERLRQMGMNNPAPSPSRRPGSRMGSGDAGDESGSKWGGLLKKIGRKASSTKLGSMYNEHIGQNESRTSSPKAMWASLPGSSASRPGSMAGNGINGSRSRLSTSPKMKQGPLPAEPQHAPMMPLTPSLPEIQDQVSDAKAPGAGTGAVPTQLQPASAMLGGNLQLSAKQARRRSFLPIVGTSLEAVAKSTGANRQEDTEDNEIGASSMDEKAMAHHRQRLRALMQYLRDLDDLTSQQSDGASPRGSPPLDTQRKLAGTSVTDVSAAAMTRNSSIASVDSSAPPSLFMRNSSRYSSTDDSSDSVDSGTQTSWNGNTIKDDSVRRIRIIEEIVHTEETYVRGLTELVEIYVKPSQMSAEGASSGGAPVVSLTEQRAVFGNVEGILHFHRDVFLPSLRSAAKGVLACRSGATRDSNSSSGTTAAQTLDADESAAVAEKVAKVFSHHAAFFKMYMSYINNCDAAQTRINVWMAPNAVINAASTFKSSVTNGQGNGLTNGAGGTPLAPEFGLTPGQRKKIRAFMKRARMHPRHSQLNVESYLLLPVQRIPRYRLLLEDLVRSTSPERLGTPDAIATALQHVSQIASSVNESKRQSEQDRKLLNWQYRIRGSFESPLVQPHRRLIKDGPLRLRRIVKRVPGYVRPQVCLPEGLGLVDGQQQQQQPQQASSSEIRQVDHLEQSSENVALSVILCNDLIVAVADPFEGRDGSGAVNLWAIVRLEKPVEMVGGVHLRLVDRKAVMYLSARSAEEAASWKTAFNSQFQQQQQQQQQQRFSM